MCDQWSDITLWWNILTPLEAQGCDKGGSKAARQLYQREYKKGSDDWFLSQQWQATARLHYTSKISGVGEISSISAQGLLVSDHSFCVSILFGNMLDSVFLAHFKPNTIQNLEFNTKCWLLFIRLYMVKLLLWIRCSQSRNFKEFSMSSTMSLLLWKVLLLYTINVSLLT